eukprot:1531936-Rhodomonas_salina.1
MSASSDLALASFAGCGRDGSSRRAARVRGAGGDGARSFLDGWGQRVARRRSVLRRCGTRNRRMSVKHTLRSS